MDLTEIEWKEINSCDICEETGFVREIYDNEGNVLMEVCFYDCMDLRNTPTSYNSVCDFCRENKGTEEVYSNKGKLNGYYCERCKGSIDSIEEEERRWEVYENEAEIDEDAKRFSDNGFAEPEDKEIVELFVNIPNHYSSHVKYLKAKYEFKSRENTLEKGSYLIIND